MYQQVSLGTGVLLTCQVNRTTPARVNRLFTARDQQIKRLLLQQQTTKIRHSGVANPSSDFSEISRTTIGKKKNNNNNKINNKKPPTHTHIQTHLCRNNEVLHCSQTTKTAKIKRNFKMKIYIQTQVYVRAAICLNGAMSWFHINCLYRSSS